MPKLQILLTILQNLLAMERAVSEDTWVLPNACQELAEIAYFGGNHDHAEKLLKRGLSYSGYDHLLCSVLMQVSTDTTIKRWCTTERVCRWSKFSERRRRR